MTTGSRDLDVASGNQTRDRASGRMLPAQAAMAVCLSGLLMSGCAGNSGAGTGGPSLPWNRRVPPSVASASAAAEASQVADPATAVAAAPPANNRLLSAPRGRLLSLNGFQDVQRRADAQARLAEQQQRELERLQSLQQTADTSLQTRLQEFERMHQETRQELQERQRLLAQKQQEAQQQVEAGRLQAQQLDRDNRDLNTRLAQSQQRTQVLEDQVDLLQQRLGETAGQLADARRETQRSSERMQALQTSVRSRGPATITANNTLMDRLTAVSIPGLDIRQDQDLVRIAIPSDELFLPGTAQLRQGAESTIGLAADVILKHYPAQIIGVEAHTDSSSLEGLPWQNRHQMTAAQAMAVLDQLVRRYRLDERQLFVLGHGRNHPRERGLVPGMEAVNRRVELVIYPERYGQR